MEKLKELGSLFYVVNPYETMFEKVSDIPTPDWTAKVIVHCTKRESPTPVSQIRMNRCGLVLSLFLPANLNSGGSL